jgi:hypothetical protein
LVLFQEATWGITFSYNLLNSKPTLKGETEEALKKSLRAIHSYRAALMTRTDFEMAKARAVDGIVMAIRMNPSSAFDNGP